MRIVGIDPATISAGLGCVDTDGRALRFVAAETITAPRRLDRIERLAVIAADLEEAIRELAPDIVALETQYTPRPGQRGGVQSALAVAGARSVAELAAWRAGVRRFAEFAPAAVKASVGAGGRADKALVSSVVARLLGLTRAPQADAGDALAIAIAAARASQR